MRVAQVIGTVTLSRCHPSLRGGTFRLVAPQSLDHLLESQREDPDLLVAYDELGSSNGCTVSISEGREAAQPFGDRPKPIDTYTAAILDHLDIDKETLP